MMAPHGLSAEYQVIMSSHTHVEGEFIAREFDVVELPYAILGRIKRSTMVHDSAASASAQCSVAEPGARLA